MVVVPSCPPPDAGDKLRGIRSVAGAALSHPGADDLLATVGYAEQVSGRPIRLAYADPSYPGEGMAVSGSPDYGGEVDHAALIAGLAEYDGWALSISAEALPAVLVCPPGSPGLRLLPAASAPPGGLQQRKKARVRRVRDGRRS